MTALDWVGLWAAFNVIGNILGIILAVFVLLLLVAWALRDTKIR